MNRPVRGEARRRLAAAPVLVRAKPGFTGEVRLIGGQWKRTKLAVPDRPGLRPTPDRVRETLFNWLGQDLTGWRVLDAFAGTGALGLEAASRGAAQVVLLDQDPGLVAAITAAAQRLGAQGVTSVRTDAMAWMARSSPALFELVLVDPPYDSGAAGAAAAAAGRLLVPGGYLYVEAGAPLTQIASGCQERKTLRAGAVFAHLWQRVA